VNRVQVRRPARLGRLPLRARRLAVTHHVPMEYSAARPAPRWLVLGTGALGILVAIELVVGLVVVSL
jgi:hypothetical protein